MLFKYPLSLLPDMMLVYTNQVERVAVPGKYVVYKNEGNLVLEDLVHRNRHEFKQ